MSIYVFKEEQKIIIHILTETWEYRGVNSIKLKYYDTLIELKYLGCGNVNGELAIMLKPLNDEMKNIDIKNTKSLLVGEAELLVVREE